MVRPFLSLWFWFLLTFHPKLEEGFEVRVNGQKEISKSLVLTGTMDSPAKADVQHHIHHNGYSGCPFCLNPGEAASTGKGSTHVYRCEPHAERTHKERVKDAKKALETGKPVSFFPFLPPPPTPQHTFSLSPVGCYR